MDRVTRIEIADTVDDAFTGGGADREDLLAAAIDKQARPEVLDQRARGQRGHQGRQGLGDEVRRGLDRAQPLRAEDRDLVERQTRLSSSRWCRA